MKITMKRSHHRPFKGVNVFKETFFQTSNDKQIIQVPKVITSFSLKIFPETWCFEDGWNVRLKTGIPGFFGGRC